MVGIVVFAISLIFSIIGLIGAIKENEYIIKTMTVLSALGVIANIMKGAIVPVIFGILITILTGTYASMIIKKKEKNSAA